MDWNRKIAKKLLAFHRGAAQEYRSLLDSFNLYVYGYGCKRAILREIFPEALEVDFSSPDGETPITHNLYEYFGRPPKATDTRTALLDINGKVPAREASEKTLVVYGARKEMLEGLSNLKIVLVQSKDQGISHGDIVAEGYIMRDLSTFVLESGEKTGVSSKIEEIINVYDCVGPISKKVFKMFLKAVASRAEYSLRDLFNREKKKLLMVNFSTFREALSPFFDSKIVQESKGICKVNLTKKELGETINWIERIVE